MFPSWIEKDGVTYFLTDKDAKAHNISYMDAAGHDAIRKLFKIMKGIEREGLNRPIPIDLERAINRGKCSKLMKVTGYKNVSLKNGLRHRLDKPAIEWISGSEEWWVKGQRHRLDGPAITWINGTKEWWVNGKRHRLDGPAVKYTNGSKEWWVNGKLHRLNKPAVEWIDGSKQWYINGKFIK